MDVRIAQPHDMPAIADLADHVFRSRWPGQHMVTEFPYFYDPSNARSPWPRHVRRSSITGRV